MGRLQAQRRVQLGIEINRGTLGWLAHRASRKILTFQHYSVTPLKRQTLLKTRPASQAGFTGRRAGVAYGSFGGLDREQSAEVLHQDCRTSEITVCVPARSRSKTSQ